VNDRPGPAAPSDRAALHAQAVDLIRQGRHRDAWQLLSDSVTRGPDDPHLLNLAGMARFHAGEQSAGAALIERAAALVPQNPGILGNLGNARLSLGDTEGGLDALRRVVAVAPDDPAGWRNLAVTLQRLAAGNAGLNDELRTALERLSALASADPWPELRLGVLDERAHRTDAAIAHYQAATRRDPRSADAWNRLGVQLGRQDRVAAAIDCYRHALAVDGNDGNALPRIVLELERGCAWHDAEAMRARLLERSEHALATGGRCIELPFAQLAYQNDPAKILRLARAWSHEIAQRAGAPLPPPPNDRDPARRLKIGFVSHDFRIHAVAELARGVLEKLDRSALEITAWSTAPDDGSAQRRSIAAAVDGFRDIAALTHRDAAQAIRAHGTDILVDLTGHTAGSRLDIAALRPAPVQVCWLGYPATTGAAFVDWLIADATVAPPGDEPFYSEALCRLPDAYLPLDDTQAIGARPTRASQRLPEQGFVFCSFNNMHKIEPVMFGLWMDLLRGVPGSVLWLHAYNDLAVTNLRAAATASGIDPTRLVFADRPAKPEHLARAGLADLALDTRLYNGHTTTIDMLWAGVPVVTLPGSTFQARVSASLLKAAGTTGTIARDIEDYRRIALAFAHEPARLAALKAQLASNRTRAPLCDTARFARKLETAFRAIWQHHCAGRAPTTLDVRV
jgi:protein O-GlcNAc transferase